jgi:hypothetical protein
MEFKKTIATIALGAATVTGGVASVDQAINPYLEETATYKLELTSEVTQGERVEINKDKAQMDLVFWNDEERISITPQIPSSAPSAINNDFNVKAKRPLLSKRMEYKSGDVTAFIEPREGTNNEFDIDFTLHAKPNTNVFEYKIEGADEFDFFYQPALTQEEMDEGASRPEHVVGSYAVYHRTKGHHRVGDTNYATGKAFHIYRPKAIDAHGDAVWAELSYQSGTLAVTVPQKFLDDATYPVTVDPTFNQTTVGATQFNVPGLNNMIALASVYLPHIASMNEIVISFSAYSVASSTTVLNVAAYSTSGGFPLNQLGAVTTSLTVNSTEDWDTSGAVSQAMTGGVGYVTAISRSNSGSGFSLFYDAASAPGRLNVSPSQNTLPLVWPGSTTDNGRRYSLYSTYIVGLGRANLLGGMQIQGQVIIR